MIIWRSCKSPQNAKICEIKTYPADSRKIASVDTHNNDLKEEKKIIKKMIFVEKQFQSLNYFDVLLSLIILLFHSNTIQELVSILIKIRDGN